MDIRTKYDIQDNLYFIHEGSILYRRPVMLSCRALPDSEGGLFHLITYHFKEDGKKTMMEKHENQVFKRRADLIKSFV